MWGEKGIKASNLNRKMHFNAHVTSRFVVKSRCQTGEASRCKNCNIAQPYNILVFVFAYYIQINYFKTSIHKFNSATQEQIVRIKKYISPLRVLDSTPFYTREKKMLLDKEKAKTAILKPFYGISIAITCGDKKRNSLGFYERFRLEYLFVDIHA